MHNLAGQGHVPEHEHDEGIIERVAEEGDPQAAGQRRGEDNLRTQLRGALHPPVL